MKVLDKYYKTVYVNFIKNIKFVKLDCWNHKAPEGFDKA